MRHDQSLAHKFEAAENQIIIGGKPMPAWLNRDYADGFIERFEPASEPMSRPVAFLSISLALIGAVFFGVGVWHLTNWIFR